MGFKKIRSESIVQQIIDAFAEEIMNGNLHPGEKVPTEKELAEKFGVGRNSVREAVKILVHMGVLEIRRAEGTFVCETFKNNMIDPMVYGIILDEAQNTEKLMELREIMEAGVIRLAARNADPRDLNNLERQLRLLKNEIEIGEDNIDNIFEADNQFHNTISEMGHNQLLSKVEDVVHVLTYAMRYQSVREMLISGKGKELYEAHEKIFGILKYHDMEDLNAAVRSTYFNQIGSNLDQEMVE